MNIKLALLTAGFFVLVVGAFVAWPDRPGWSDEPEQRASDPVEVPTEFPAATCVSGEHQFHTCPDGTSVAWCVCQYSGCQPECQNVGTRSEGWYDSCLGLRYEWTMCNTCQPVCRQIGTWEEGWYDSCDGHLIVHGTCRGAWQCIEDPESACGGESCTPEGQLRVSAVGMSPCCEGLVPIACTSPNDFRECPAKCTSTSFCTQCGDGSCAAPENPCNCPVDCR